MSLCDCATRVLLLSAFLLDVNSSKAAVFVNCPLDFVVRIPIDRTDTFSHPFLTEIP